MHNKKGIRIGEKLRGSEKLRQLNFLVWGFFRILTVHLFNSSNNTCLAIHLGITTALHHLK